MADPAAQTMKLNATMEEVRDLLKRMDERLARLEIAAGIVEPVEPTEPESAPVEAQQGEQETEGDSKAEEDLTEAEQEKAAKKSSKGRGH